MNLVFHYALNVRLLLRAINECQTHKSSNTGLSVWYLVISVIWKLTGFNTNLCLLLC